MTKSKLINRKWDSKEKVIAVAMTTHGRNDFKKQFPGAYRAANYTLCFYEDLSNLMISRGVWKEDRRKFPSKYRAMTDEQIFNTAKQAETLTELHRKYFLLCAEAKRRGIYDKIESQFKRLVHENGYWTEARIYAKARKSSSRSEFSEESACHAAVRFGIYDKLVEDMAAEGIWDLSHYTHWDKESCLAKIREYETKSELIEDCFSAYTYALKHGFLEEACEHMERLGSAVLRKIYAFEFEDNSAYVGLSYDPYVRLQRHLHEEDSSVYLHIKSTQCPYEFKVLTELLDKDEAAVMEETFRLKYAEEGWHILNRMKCGGLGGVGTPKYTIEEIKEEIKKLGIKTRNEFNKRAKGMYLYAWRRNWLDEICAEMPQREKSTKKIKWNDEMLNWAVSQCNSRTELRIKYPRAYQILLERGTLDAIFPKKNPNNVRWHKS